MGYHVFSDKITKEIEVTQNAKFLSINYVDLLAEEIEKICMEGLEKTQCAPSLRLTYPLTRKLILSA